MLGASLSHSFSFAVFSVCNGQVGYDSKAKTYTFAQVWLLSLQPVIAKRILSLITPHCPTFAFFFSQGTQFRIKDFGGTSGFFWGQFDFFDVRTNSKCLTSDRCVALPQHPSLVSRSPRNCGRRVTTISGRPTILDSLPTAWASSTRDCSLWYASDQ